VSGNRSQMGSNLESRPDMTDRPLPDVNNPFSKLFWEACTRHELTLQKCSMCGTVRYYPRPYCPECQSGEATWINCSGRATVYSFTTVHRPLTRWFKTKVPITVAIVELEEGTRMMTNIIDVDPELVSVGMQVEVTFEDVADGVTLPLFRPAQPTPKR
jgi:uncharacterized protein